MWEKNARDFTAIERVGEVRVAGIGVDSNIVDENASGKTSKSRSPRPNSDVSTAGDCSLVCPSRISDWVHVEVELEKKRWKWLGGAGKQRGHDGLSTCTGGDWEKSITDAPP